MAGNQSAWRNRPVDLTKNTLSDGRDLSSGKKKDEEEDDFKVDEDFKEFDLFNDKSGGFDDDEEDDF